MIRILKKDPANKRIKVQVDNGTILTCRPVRQLPVQELLFKLGVDDKMLTSVGPAEVQTALGGASAEKQVEVARASLALFNYCMAYGIVEEPPEEAVEELQALGVAPNSKAALRARWLNYMVLKNADEAGLLTGIILVLTFRDDALEEIGEANRE